MVTSGLADQERFRTLAREPPWPVMRSKDLIAAGISVLTAPVPGE